MAQYQKFMFDNFVISCEDDKCTSQTLEDAETEELETDSEEQETEEIIETKAEEVEEEKPQKAADGVGVQNERARVDGEGFLNPAVLDLRNHNGGPAGDGE